MTATDRGPADRPDDAFDERPANERPANEDMPHDMSQDISQDMSQDAPQDMSQGMSQGMSQDMSQDAPQDRPQDTGGPADEPPVRLLQADELQAVVSRWREIQAEFVDQPKRAMQEADELVSELMNRLSQTFAAQREQLESRWSDTDTISTEELRQGLQRYRSFFERLLAA